MITRSDPYKRLQGDRVWIVDTTAERADVPGSMGDIVHDLQTDTWWLWRPDNSWVPLEANGGGGAAQVLESYVLLTPNALTFTNAPSGGLEVTTLGGSRAQLDLRTAQNVVGQVSFSVIPHNVGVARFEYSTDGGTVWDTLVDMETGYTANVLKVSAATAVPAGAKTATCQVRVVVTGNGVVDPVLQKAALTFQGA